MSKKVEVIVACMNQQDKDLYSAMNLQTDAVLANQCNFNSSVITNKGNNRIAMISTNGRGVGKNRNIGILNSTGDYLLFADEDMIYEDDYEEMVIKAFEKIPQADMIVFNLNYLNSITKTKKKEISNIKRLFWFNSMKYGTARIAIKKEVLLKKNIWFSLLYGGGALYGSGEDSLFIRESLKKNVKMYTYPYTLAKVKQETSSWFKGYNNKYFIDKGVLIANLFPLIKYILAIFYSYKLKRFSPDKSFFCIFKLILTGIKKYNNRS